MTRNDDERIADILDAGATIVAGGEMRAVATVVDIIVDDIVHVRPLRGPVSQHRHLLARRQAS